MLLFSVTDVRGFMNALLREETFCSFEARGITLATFTTFEIDCLQNESSTSEEETTAEKKRRQYCRWAQLQPVVFELIKGKKRPRLFKLQLGLGAEPAEKIHQNAASLHITFKYENDEIQALTGCSQKQFALDKAVDQAWDQYVEALFRQRGLGIEQLS